MGSSQKYISRFAHEFPPAVVRDAVQKIVLRTAVYIGNRKCQDYVYVKGEYQSNM